jgi:hypothetical protein
MVSRGGLATPWLHPEEAAGFCQKKLQWAEPQAIIFPTLPFYVPL